VLNWKIIRFMQALERDPARLESNVDSLVKVMLGIADSGKTGKLPKYASIGVGDKATLMGIRGLE